MKKLKFLTVLLAGFVVLITGCAERRVYVPVYTQPSVVAANPQAPAPGSVVVSQPPPAPLPEVLPVSPSPDYYWVPGYWTWQGQWVWVSGAWVLRPRPESVWIGGRWTHHPRGWEWERGHWR